MQGHCFFLSVSVGERACFVDVHRAVLFLDLVDFFEEAFASFSFMLLSTRFMKSMLGLKLGTYFSGMIMGWPLAMLRAFLAARFLTIKLPKPRT